MPLRALLRYLANNEQLIQKLADSHLMRRAAQLTAFFFHKGKEIGEDKLERFKESDAINRLQNEAKHSASKFQQKVKSTEQKTGRFMSIFLNNLEEEWKKAEKRLQDQKKAITEKKDKER